MPGRVFVVESLLATSKDSRPQSRLESIDALRRKRLALVALVGAVLSLCVILLQGALLTGSQAQLVMTPPHLEWMALVFHAASFSLAAILFRQSKLHTQTILALDLILFASNIAVRSVATIAYTNYGDHFPGIEGIMLALVLHSVLVPTTPLFAGCLTGVALVSFVAAQFIGLSVYPEVAAHWAGFSSSGGFETMVALGAFGIAAFGVLSILSAKIFYGLAKKVIEGQQIGNYEISREIGSGGMGKVFAGEHLLLKRPTAVKTIHPGQFAGDEALSRFEREVELACTLTHPNTISIYDFGRSDGGVLYYAMEYLEGIDLEKLVKQYGPVPLPRAVHILRQVCFSLREAHQKNIIHRDIKPSNILLTERGGVYDFVKVIDFGLAKDVSAAHKAGEETDEAALTRSGAVFGTVHYMAPESVFGVEKLDQRADIYSFGAVAYWLLAGRHLFEGAAQDILVDHIKTPPTKLSKVSEVEVDAAFEALVMKCLEKKAENRPSSMQEVLDIFEDLLDTHKWTETSARDWWQNHRPLEEAAKN